MKMSILISFFFLYSFLHSQDRLLFSPGVKFGYAFGQGGGSIYGLEISFMVDPDISNPHNSYGAVVTYEITRNENRLHLGAQVNFSKYKHIWEIAGIEIGPTYIFKDNLK